MNMLIIVVSLTFLVNYSNHRILILVNKETEEYVRRIVGFEVLQLNVNDTVCQNLNFMPSIILDTTDYSYDMDNFSSNSLPIIYQKIDISMNPVFKLVTKYVFLKDVTHYAIIFQTHKTVEEYLIYLINNNVQKKVFATFGFNMKAIKYLKKVRPYPEGFIVVCDSKSCGDFYQLLKRTKYLTFPDQWHFITTDYSDTPLDLPLVNILRFTYVHQSAQNIFDLQLQILPDLLNFLPSNNETISTNLCELASVNRKIENKYWNFEKLINNILTNNYLKICENNVICLKINGTLNNSLGFFESNGQIVFDGHTRPTKWVLRIGTTFAMPWSYTYTNASTGDIHWTGYCMELVEKLSQELDFDYEIIVPKNGTFGKKLSSGVWDGTIGDLIRGDTDMIATALVMTSQREEVIDFIVPYFEDTGISIVIRKQLEATSLFKFLSVFKKETWFTILATIFAIATLLWFIEIASPLSSTKHELKYTDYFWFCCRSLTPLGMERIPKSYSGRILVAFYWLYIALIMATFTANLATFLTSEKLKTPIRDLEQLVSQSRIKYTVVKGSSAHQYFINMKHAEDTIYRMWKELVLNASSDETIYQVWDYPVKELFGEALVAINDSNPVDTLKEGISNVNNRYDSDYALIHDSSELAYEMNQNCNLSEVGTPFGIRPYALAVAQGALFLDQFSAKIVKLKDKTQFFEELKIKYWNDSLRKQCDGSTDEEGIQLRNIGGLFIGASVGFVIALIIFGSDVVDWVLFQKNAQTSADVQINVISANVESSGPINEHDDVSSSLFPYVD